MTVTTCPDRITLPQAFVYLRVVPYSNLTLLSLTYFTYSPISPTYLPTYPCLRVDLNNPTLP